MNFFKIFGLVFIFIFFSTMFTNYSIASDLNIFVVDINMIFKESHAEKDAKSEIEIKQKEMEKVLDKLAREISNLSENCNRESSIMNDKSREKKNRELRIRSNDFKALKVKFQEELDFLQKKLILDIENEIINIISSIGEEKDCTLIINSSSVLYFDQSVDITDAVLNKYNDNYIKLKSK